MAADLTATLHHVDHGLRAGSAREAEVVARLAESLGCAMVRYRVQVAPGGNLEARARAARRAALPPGALTAHTMDDQAETVVLNLLRGASTDGLAGMAGPTKPLLALRRAEVHAFVHARGVEHVTDPTNADLSLLRNLVRARVLPELCRVAGRDLVEVLARQADLLRADASLLDALAAEAVPDVTDVAALVAAPVALRRRRLRDLARSSDPESHPPSLDEVLRMERVVLGEAIATELHGGRRLARTKGRLRLEGG